MPRTVNGLNAGAFGSYTSFGLATAGSTAASAAGTWIAQPAVPATGVPFTTTADRPMTVVIAANGATITNVTVNGITVGAGAGTYTVPAFGSISIAYTVATPTWVWSFPVTFLAALNANLTPVSQTGV